MNLPNKDERGFFKKAGKIRDREVYDAYLVSHPYCACCGRRGKLSRHHIIGGAGRSDEVVNLAVLCLFLCHPLAEGERVANGNIRYEPLSLGQILTLKRLRFPDEVNLERLAELYGQPLPEEEPLPAWVGEMYQRNQRHRR